MNAERLLEVYEQISEAPDAIARLRRFVLDLAVHGKLVEQNAADKPASNSLETFTEIKADLVKRKVIRKPKALKPISDVEALSFTPSGWETQRLGSTSILITKGSTPTSYGHEFTQEGVNFLKVESIRNDRVDASNITAFISNETHAFLSRSQLEAGDILFSIAGSIGTCAVVSADVIPANTNQALAIIRGTATVFSPAFLLLLLRSFVSDAVKDRARGGAMNNVSLTDLQNLVLPIPPFAEQHRIVAKVDELMALCDRLEEARKKREELRDKLTAASLARLTAPDTTAEDLPAHAAFALEAIPALTTRPDQIKTLRRTILNLAVRGKLVEQDVGDEPAAELLERIRDEKAERVAAGLIRTQMPLEPVAPNEREFDLPENWVWVRLGEVVKLWNGIAFKSSDFGTVGIPVVRIGDLKGGVVNITSAACVSEKIASQASEEVWIPNGALLLAMSGATTGKTAFNKTGQRLLLNQRVGRIEPFQVNIHFIRFFFETIIARNLSISLGTAIPNLSAKQVNETAIPLPPLAEQHRIVAKVDALIALCDRLEAALITADTTRTRLLETLLCEAMEPAANALEAAE